MRKEEFSMTQSVRVNNRYQITVPRVARERLNIQALWEFAWMTDRSPELVRVLRAAPPTSWGVQYPDHAKSQRANIHKGDRLLVDVQDGLLILLPQPKDYTAHLAGLDTDAYLREEREAWHFKRVSHDRQPARLMSKSANGQMRSE